MKNLILVIVMLFSIAATAHNPLAGTKWKMNGEDGKTAFTINFNGQTQGSLDAGGNVCDFNYSASHTQVFLTIADCNDKKAGSGIIPCCEQTIMPFKQHYQTAEAPAKLVLTIDSKEYELVKAE